MNIKSIIIGLILSANGLWLLACVDLSDVSVNHGLPGSTVTLWGRGFAITESLNEKITIQFLASNASGSKTIYDQIVYTQLTPDHKLTFTIPNNPNLKGAGEIWVRYERPGTNCGGSAGIAFNYLGESPLNFIQKKLQGATTSVGGGAKKLLIFDKDIVTYSDLTNEFILFKNDSEGKGEFTRTTVGGGANFSGVRDIQQFDNNIHFIDSDKKHKWIRPYSSTSTHSWEVNLPSYYYGMTIGDLDMDGDADIIAGQYPTVSQRSLGWYYNTSASNAANGVIQQNLLNMSTDYPYRATVSIGFKDGAIIEARDFDHDGFTDIIAQVDVNSGSWSSNLVMYKNLLSESSSIYTLPSFSNKTIIRPYAYASPVTTLTSADLDGDGDLDLIVGSIYEKISAWFENQGGGNFSERKTFDTGGSANIAQSFAFDVGDLDGDGDMDILSIRNDNQIAWFENNGSESFSSPKIITNSLGNVRDVKFMDINSDGDLDIVYVDKKFNEIGIFENVNTGNDILSFTFAEVSAASNNPEIDLSNHVVNIEVLNGTDLSNLTPSYSLSKGALVENSPSDFTSDVDFNVMGEDLVNQTWTISVNAVPDPVVASFDVNQSSINIQWDKVDYATEYHLTVLQNGSPYLSYTNYSVIAGNQSNIVGETISLGVLSGLLPNTTYTVSIEAVSRFGTESATYSEVIKTAPSAPTNLQLVSSSVTNSAFQISWQNSGNVSNRIRVNSGENIVIDSIVLDNTTSFQAAELTAGTSYDVSISSTNDQNRESSSIELKNILTAPSAPSLSVVLTENILTDSVLIRWNAPQGIAERYEVSITPNGGASFLANDIADTFYYYTSTNTSFIKGKTFSAKVRAQNIANLGATNDSYSEYSNEVQFLTRPSAPTLSTTGASNVTSNSFIANWNTVEGAISYTIEVSEDDFQTLIDSIDQITNTNVQVSGLEGGKNYSYRLIALNSSGSSNYSTIGTILTAPLAPSLTEVILDEISQNSAILRWASETNSQTIELSNTDYAQSTNYVIGFPLEVNNVDSLNIGINPSTFSLTPSTQYWARIKAKNATGFSAVSNVVSFLTRPSAVNPNSINFSNISQSSAQVIWTRVQNVTDYRYDLSLNEQFEPVLEGFDNVLVSSSSSQVVKNIEGLSAGTNYFIRIRSVNATGDAPYSTPKSFTTGPANPTMDSVFNITTFSASVNWNKVPTATDYRLDVSSTSFATYVNGYQNRYVEDSISQISNLQPGTIYKARVVAYNNSSNSGYSDTLEFITIPSPPSNLATNTITLQSARCSWNDPGGVTSYDFQLSSTQTFSDTLFEDNTTSTNIDLDDLTQRTVYYFRVRANNESGSSAFESSNFETDGEENIAPTGINLSNRSLDENNAQVKFVGKLTTTDANSLESFTYSLVGSGNDNGSFSIKTDSLFTNAAFNFETKSTYQIDIQTRDSGGLTYTGSLEITIRDVNDTPTNLSLSNTETVAFTAIDTEIGALTVSDEDAAETHTFSIDTDTDAFQISGTSLSSAVEFTNEEDSTVTLQLRATDSKEAFVTSSFEILIKKFIDTEVPLISNLSDPEDFATGSEPITLSVEVSDFRISTVNFKMRALTTEDFETIDVSNQKSPYTITISEADFDGVGMEFYVTSEDASGNMAESEKRKISLSFSAASSPAIESITRFGGKVEDYEIISIPFVFGGTGNRVQEIFNEYNGGIPDKTIWRLIKYNPSITPEVSGLEDLVASSPIRLGEGYFFNAKEAAEIKIGAAQVNSADPQEIVLQPGWNLIGNPYIVDIDWSAVLTRNGIPEVGPLRILDPNDPARWPESNMLEKYKGAFVNLMSSTSQTITITYADKVPAGGRISSVDQPDYDWVVPLSLIQGENKGSGTIGMHQEAKAGVDQFDALTLPRWLRYLEVTFKHPEYSFGNFSKDIAPVSNSYSWEFEVSSDQEGMTSLHWGELSESQTNLKLLDVSQDRIIDMVNQTKYSFDLQGAKSFKVFYSQDPDDLFTSERISIGEAYPNPFDKEVNIPISLPEHDGLFDVKLEVMDLAGQVIWQAEDQLGPGIFEFTMPRPSSMTSGLYLYKLSVKSTGVERQFTKKFVVK